jgi:3-oxoacyl-[acyl-carrier-protein] synthase-3
VEAAQKGQLKIGDKIVFVGFGAGLTWGAMVVEWTGPTISAAKHISPEQYRLFARLRRFVRRAIRFVEGLFSRKEI